MSTRRVEIQYVSRVAGLDQVRALASASKELDGSIKGAKTSTDESAEAFNRASRGGDALATTLLRQAAAAAAYSKAVKEILVDSATYAARTQTLNIVLDQMIKTNGLGANAVRAQVQAVRQLGVVNQEAISSTIRMINAQLDLGKATDLARLAQNAGVIGNKTTAEALEGIVTGITTRQTDVLATYGIIVQFEDKLNEARRIKRRELTATEKVEVAFQEVLKQGVKIQGAYEASMLTAGKQMLSLSRYTDEAREAIGTRFLPTLSATVIKLTDLAKWLKENADLAAGLGAGLVSAGAAAAVARYVPGGPLVKGAAAAATFLGAEAFLNQDPIALQGELLNRRITELAEKRKELNRQYQTGGIPREQYERYFQELIAAEKLSREATERDVAKLIEERRKSQSQTGRVLSSSGTRALLDRGMPGLGAGVQQAAGIFGAYEIPETVTLGGRTYTQKDFAEILRREKDDVGTGLLVNKALRAKDDQAVLARQFAESLAKGNEKARQYLDKLDVGAASNPFERLLIEQAQFFDDLRRDGLAVSPNLAQQIRQRVNERTRILFEEMEAKERSARQSLDRRLNLGGVATPQDQIIFELGLAFQRDIGLPSQPSETSNRFNANLAASFARDIEQAEAFRQQARDRELQYMERLIQLRSGPGGEIAAIIETGRLRIQAAEREFELAKGTTKEREAELKLTATRSSASQQAQLQILDMQKREREEFGRTVAQAYTAFRSNGRDGLSGFVRSYFGGIEQKFVQNLAESQFDRFRVQLPGQGTSENPTFLGRLLRGTPFGLRSEDALKSATDLNTQVTAANSAAMINLTAAMGGAGLPTIGGQFAAISGPTGIVPGFSPSVISDANGITGQGNSTLSTILSGAGSFPFRLFGGRASEIQSKIPAGAGATAVDSEVKKYLGLSASANQQATFSNQYGSTSQTAAVYAAAGAGAVFGVIGGMRQGGARGALTAAGSILGAAAVFSPEPISKGILTLAALGTSMLGGLLPDPRKQRADEQQRILEGSRYEGPRPLGLKLTSIGEQFDYGASGALRSAGTTIVIQQQNSFDFIDASGLAERGPMLADALMPVIADEHGLTQVIRKQINPS